MNLSPFCTCDDHTCPLNPVNHDKGCSLCIAKNLKLREIPNCFFNMVDPEHTSREYHFEDFARCVMKNEQTGRRLRRSTIPG